MNEMRLNKRRVQSMLQSGGNHKTISSLQSTKRIKEDNKIGRGGVK